MNAQNIIADRKEKGSEACMLNRSPYGICSETNQKKAKTIRVEISAENRIMALITLIDCDLFINSHQVTICKQEMPHFSHSM